MHANKIANSTNIIGLPYGFPPLPAMGLSLRPVDWIACGIYGNTNHRAPVSKSAKKAATRFSSANGRVVRFAPSGWHA
jgi:hypothetical protein